MTKTSGNSIGTGSKKCSTSKRDSRGREAIPNFHKVILLLVTSRDREFVRKACVEKLGLSETKAKKAVDEAISCITLAADYDRKVEIGKAIIRLDDIFEKSMRVQDQKNALATQKEVNKLLDLYATPDRTESEDTHDENNALDTVREYLLPLELGDDETPTVELARLAALKIMELTDS